MACNRNLRRLINLLLLLTVCITTSACGEQGNITDNDNNDKGMTENTTENTAEITTEETKEDDSYKTVNSFFHIGIVTGSFSQSEDDRRGAEAFQEKYGDEMVTLAIYPDNFAEKKEKTIQTIVSLADDPKMKAIIVNQAVDGTAEAFRKIYEVRPDILCIAGEAYEDFDDIGAEADLVVNYDFISRGYLMIRSAHELGCNTFVHVSFPRHLEYESVSRQVAIMKAACEEFDMKFEMETAPDPTTEKGVPEAQQYITEHVPEWIEKYGKNAAFFCTNDAHTEPLIKGLLESGGYFIEADLPSPLMGYPGALDLDLTDYAGDFDTILAKIENAVVKEGGAGRFGTWAYSYGYSVSTGLAEHARNVILGDSELNDINDISKALGSFSVGAMWNGSEYIDADTGSKSDNIFLVYQDTYIMGDPGRFLGITKVEVPEKYFTVK